MTVPAPKLARTCAMPAQPSPYRTSAFAVAWALLGVWALGLAWWLVRYWGANPEYADRLVVPSAAAWLVWRRRHFFGHLPPDPTWSGLPLVTAVAAFPPAWFLGAQVGPRSILLWWGAACWLAAAAGL